MSHVRVNLGDILVRELLHFFLGLFLVFSSLVSLALTAFFKRFHRVATHMAHGHARVLGHAMGDLHEFLAAFGAQFRERDADDFSPATTGERPRFAFWMAFSIA